MTHGRSSILATLATTAVLAAGCGGGDRAATAPAAAPASSAAATPAAAAPARTPTKREYLIAADKLCGEARTIAQSGNRAVAKAFASKSALNAAKAIDSFGPAYGTKIEALLKLPRPRGDGQVLDQLMAVLTAQVRALGLQATALRAGDSKKLQELTQAQTDAAQGVAQLAAQYGFRICGRG